MNERRYHELKRLHALTGIFPVGLFLACHFAVNFTAVLGPDAFNRVAERLDRLPFVGWLELLVIGVPIAAHVGLGALLGNSAPSFTAAHGYPRPWMRSFQRWTGGILVVYVLYHVWSTRLSPEVMKGERDLYRLMNAHLSDPAVVAFYVIGVLAACAHFAVGLFEVTYRWGRPGTAPAAARSAGGEPQGGASIAPANVGTGPVRLAWAAFTGLALVGLGALVAFVVPRG